MLDLDRLQEIDRALAALMAKKANHGNDMPREVNAA
jgi:hypothetical protein